MLRLRPGPDFDSIPEFRNPGVSIEILENLMFFHPGPDSDSVLELIKTDNLFYHDKPVVEGFRPAAAESPPDPEIPWLRVLRGVYFSEGCERC